MIYLYRPIKTNFLNQKFGENRACYNPVTKAVYGRATEQQQCPVGSSPFYNLLGMSGHNGEDWRIYHGEPIYHAASFPGTAKTEIDRDGGIGVDVVSKEPLYQDKHLKIRYWHLKKPLVYDGQEVYMGQMIAYGDSTGASSGDHLHWALKLCDKNGKSSEPWNGFFGAIDFRKLEWVTFENEFVLTILNLKQQISALQTIVYLYSSIIRKLSQGMGAVIKSVGSYFK
jgi:murein DD-endopeptidase MepM/ murein hydrolase activator NlpD